MRTSEAALHADEQMRGGSASLVAALFYPASGGAGRLEVRADH